MNWSCPNWIFSECVHGALRGLACGLSPSIQEHFIVQTKHFRTHWNTHTLSCVALRFISEDFYLIEIHTRHLKLLRQEVRTFTENNSTLTLPLHNIDLMWLNKNVYKCWTGIIENRYICINKGFMDTPYRYIYIHIYIYRSLSLSD